MSELKVHALTNALVSGMPGYEEVDLGGGLLVPEVVRFEVRGLEEGSNDVIVCEARFRDGRYHVTQIEGSSLTGALLRKIPVQDILRTAIVDSANWTVKDPHGVAIRFVVRGGPFFDPEIAKHGPTPEALQAVATIYRLAYAIGDNPTQAVATNLSLAGSTAGRWVMKARSAGFLGETEPGKAGA